MAAKTRIEWTHHTFNPWHGCTKISPGCANCYAETRDGRHLYEPVDHWGPGAPRMRLSAEYWMQPYKWNRAAQKAKERRRVFCASMADIFEVEAPQQEQRRLWPLIEGTPDLDWQLLTKRPERILEVIPAPWRESPPANVWYGTSIENADYVWRVRALREVPAAVRFLSVEPLLGPIPNLPLDGIGWVIVGGESGSGARPMQPAWARQIRDQCAAAQVPFFFKQWGQFDAHGTYYPDKADIPAVLDGREWRQFPEHIPGPAREVARHG